MVRGNRVDYVFGLPGSKPLVEENRRGGGRGSHRTRFVEQATSCAATPKRATRPNPGAASGAPSPASKPRRSASTSASSSPTSNTARRNGFTPPSIARAGRPRTSSSCTRRSSLPIERPAVPPIANQVRLVLHTAAYWLMLTVRDAIPKPRDLAKAEFSTLRLRLIKIAARVIETASRVRLAFAAGCPEADLFRGLPGALARSAPERRGKEPLRPPHPSNAFAKVSVVRR